jgi:hypothetical protein
VSNEGASAAADGDGADPGGSVARPVLADQGSSARNARSEEGRLGYHTWPPVAFFAFGYFRFRRFFLAFLEAVVARGPAGNFVFL